MKSIFSNLKLVEFESSFSEEENCLELLASEKWKNGHVCRKCGNTNYCAGKMPFSRRCTRCKSDESATAHTIFHRCKIPLNEAFKIAYLVCGQPDISSYDLSKTLDKRQMTCWKFKKKISECLQKGGKFSLIGD
jgi:hypothetical protein